MLGLTDGIREGFKEYGSYDHVNSHRGDCELPANAGTLYKELPYNFILMGRSPVRAFFLLISGGNFTKSDSDKKINKWTDDILRHFSHMIRLINDPDTVPYCKTYAVI